MTVPTFRFGSETRRGVAYHELVRTLTRVFWGSVAMVSSLELLLRSISAGFTKRYTMSVRHTLRELKHLTRQTDAISINAPRTHTCLDRVSCRFQHAGVNVPCVNRGPATLTMQFALKLRLRLVAMSRNEQTFHRLPFFVRSLTLCTHAMNAWSVATVKMGSMQTLMLRPSWLKGCYRA